MRDMAIFTVITISTVHLHGSTYFTLDVNSIIVKRIFRTFSKYTRQLSRLRTAAMSNVHVILLQSGEPVAGETENSLISEAVTAVWNDLSR